MICRDAAVEEGRGIARVWAAAWRAAYAGLMPAEYLDRLDIETAIARWE